MEAVCGDAGAAQPTTQLPAEEEVCQLGLVVSRYPGVLPALPVQVREVDGAGLVGQRGHSHDPEGMIGGVVKYVAFLVCVIPLGRNHAT